MVSRGNSECRTVSILTAMVPSLAADRCGTTGGRSVDSELAGGSSLRSATGSDSATVLPEALNGNEDFHSGLTGSETGDLKREAGLISAAADAG